MADAATIRTVRDLTDRLTFVFLLAPDGFPVFRHGPRITTDSEFDRLREGFPVAKNSVDPETYDELCEQLEIAHQHYKAGDVKSGSIALQRISARILGQKLIETKSRERS